MSDASVTLYGHNLYSNWGFCDGELLDEFATDLGVDHHDLLVGCVQRYLLPALPRHVETYGFEITCHNPIRTEEPSDPAICAIEVEISADQIADVARGMARTQEKTR